MVNRPDFLDGLVEPRPSAAAEATRSSLTPSFPCINSSAVHLAGGEILPLVMVDMASAMVSSIRSRHCRGGQKKFKQTMDFFW